MSVYIISELCGQWGGSVDKAKTMIDQSKEGGADAVKVQLWDTYRMPGENRENWEYLSMTEDQFLELKEHAEKLNIDYFASPFHEDRFNWIINSGLKTNKIASTLVSMDFSLCEKMLEHEQIEKTFCSLGKWNEIEMPFVNRDIFYFHCVPNYPHDFEEALELMPVEFNTLLVGYSDHSIGIESCKEAVRRGATVLEKHFTLDHFLQSDTEGAHACSMNFSELIQLRKFCDEYN